jgi:hypothetical protein
VVVLNLEAWVYSVYPQRVLARRKIRDSRWIPDAGVAIYRVDSGQGFQISDELHDSCSATRPRGPLNRVLDFAYLRPVFSSYGRLSRSMRSSMSDSKESSTSTTNCGVWACLSNSSSSVSLIAPLAVGPAVPEIVTGLVATATDPVPASVGPSRSSVASGAMSFAVPTRKWVWNHAREQSRPRFACWRTEIGQLPLLMRWQFHCSFASIGGNSPATDIIVISADVPILETWRIVLGRAESISLTRLVIAT